MSAAQVRGYGAQKEVLGREAASTNMSLPFVTLVAFCSACTAAGVMPMRPGAASCSAGRPVTSSVKVPRTCGFWVVPRTLEM